VLHQSLAHHLRIGIGKITLVHGDDDRNAERPFGLARRC
jgi:hypothetical protein